MNHERTGIHTVLHKELRAEPQARPNIPRLYAPSHQHVDWRLPMYMHVYVYVHVYVTTLRFVVGQGFDLLK